MERETQDSSTGTVVGTMGVEEPKMAEQAEGVLFVVTKVVLDVVMSPLNVALVGVIVLLVYTLLVNRRGAVSPPTREARLPKMKKKDFTLEQLRQFKGDAPPDGRVLIAVNGKVFDVTRGKKFYGPGGPYAAFAGSDATRGLATFSVDPGKDEYDDLSDLNSMQMESVKEWELQFTEKYDYVGRLLKPGEEPNDYSDEEDSVQSSTKANGDDKKTLDAQNKTDDSTEKSKDD